MVNAIEVMLFPYHGMHFLVQVEKDGDTGTVVCIRKYRCYTDGSYHFNGFLNQNLQNLFLSQAETIN